MEIKYINTSLYAQCIRSNVNFKKDFISLYREAAKSVPKNVLINAFLANQKKSEARLAA